MIKGTSLDTETDFRLKIPFIATSYDGKKEPMLYDISSRRDFKRLKSFAENPNKIKIFHSASFDVYALTHLGINVPFGCYHDTKVMSSHINENFKSDALKELARVHLGKSTDSEKELNKIKAKYRRKYKSEFTYSMIPAEILHPYAKDDAVYTYDLAEHFLNINPSLLDTKVYNLEMRLVPIIVKMQKAGHMIDRRFCKQEKKRLLEQYRLAYNKFLKVTGGHWINTASNPQIQELFKILGIKDGNKTKGSTEKNPKFSTDKEAMKKLRKKHKAFKYLEICRSINHKINNYYDPLLQRYTTVEDDTAHFLFNQSGAKTGRFSAELIQTIPKEREEKDDPIDAMRVRKAFKVRPGYINFYFDYDQIEMRLFAHFSQNQFLINAILAGEDAHTATASDLFDIPIHKVNKFQRKIAKVINFGIIYGMGLELLILQLGLSRQEGVEILNKYHRKFRVQDFIRKTTRELYRQGFIELPWIGRRYNVPKDLAYKGVNVKIQGSAAYVMKLGMINVDDYIVRNHPSSVNLIVTVHDELVYEVPEFCFNHNKFVSAVKERMEALTLFDVPITTSVKFSDSTWNNTQKWRVAA